VLDLFCKKILHYVKEAKEKAKNYQGDIDNLPLGKFTTCKT
jgi:hypothetical protein